MDSFHILNDESYNRLSGKNAPKPKRTKEDWRSIFALIILAEHFAIVGAIVFIWMLGKDIDEVTKVLSTVGALLGSPLGFVIGYYYKNQGK